MSIVNENIAIHPESLTTIVVNSMDRIWYGMDSMDRIYLKKFT